MKRQLVLGGLEDGGWFLFCLVTVVAAGVLIGLLLRYERNLVPRHIGNGLLLLRMAVLAVLFLTLLEPVLSWTLDREQAGRVLVALDLSESMSTADKHAGKAEKLRWARGLGMIGNAAINDRLDRWIEAFESGREPEWVTEAETTDPQRRRRLEEARKENTGEIFEQIDAVSRKELAHRLLTSTDSPLLPELGEVANVELVLFAGKSHAVDVDMLSPEIISHPPLRLAPGATDLGEALSAAGAEPSSARVLGVVLLTDGRDNSSTNASAGTAGLVPGAAPVYPVMFGSELRPKDLSIQSLDYPLTAFQDDKPLLKLVLGTSQFEGEEITVVLERDDEEPQVKSVTPDGPTATLEFQLDASRLGRHAYTVRTDIRPGETRDDNNQKSFSVNIVDDQVRALLVEGESRWEFRFLDNALTRDTRVEVDRVVFRQPYLGVLAETFFPRRLDLPADANDLEDSPFAEPDLVILGDVAPENFREKAWSLLERFVTDAGGTLVFVAGKRHFPLEYDSEILDRLLPVTRLRPVNATDFAGHRLEGGPAPPTERGFQLRLTPDGENLSVFSFDTDRLINRRVWSALPGHSWGLVGEAKPGATVLATAKYRHARQAAGSRLRAERQNAVIVHQHYGFGQVLWIGIDSTWRWRHRVGDRYHHRFWGQLCRWAAENKATAGNNFVKFGPERSDIEVGEDALIRARWTRQFLRKFPNLKAEVEIYRRDDEPTAKPLSTLALKPDKARALVHQARVVSLPVGEYRVKLVARHAELGEEPIETMLYVNEVDTPELSDLSANRELLAQLAERTGGRLLLPDEAGQLPELLRGPATSSVVGREIALWDHFLVLLLFFALLTTEWVIRKLYGLP